MQNMFCSHSWGSKIPTFGGPFSSDTHAVHAGLCLDGAEHRTHRAELDPQVTRADAFMQCATSPKGRGSIAWTAA